MAWAVAGDTSGSLGFGTIGNRRVISTPSVFPDTSRGSQFGDGCSAGAGTSPAAISAIGFTSAGRFRGRRASAGVEDLRGLRWATGGFIELIIGETRYTSARYRVDMSNGAYTASAQFP